MKDLNEKALRRYLKFFLTDTTQWMKRNVKKYLRFFSEKDLLIKIILNKLKIETRRNHEY